MRKHIVFVITEDWVFVSHRLHLAKSALKTGMKVSIVCNVSIHGELLKNCGFDIIDWQLERGSKNIFEIIFQSLKFYKLLSRLEPDILHIVALKPILISGIFSIFNSKVKKIFCITGLGFIFTSKRFSARVLSVPVRLLLSKILKSKNSVTVVQNKDDRMFATQALFIPKENVKLIAGAGVNIKIFKSQNNSRDKIVVALPARLLVDKGVHEFVEVAKIINSSNKDTIFRLIGDVDPHNPNSVSKYDLFNWVSKGIVEWNGFETNMVKALREVHIICFPSYREGLPKALLEAFACGKPVVAFDVPGCREIVLDEQNGFLVPFKNTNLMAIRVKKLIKDRRLREMFGKSGRRLVETSHTEEVIQKQFKNLWN